MGTDDFLEFAAGVFGVPAETLSLETTFGSIPQWDSLAQLRLVMAIADRYGVEIPFADVPNVTSLWEFRRRVRSEPIKKVLAVDLDNTLWHGIVGEDGPDGIRPNVAFERSLKELKNRGVLLVVLSKNNWEDAERGMRRLTALSPDDFVSIKINWRSKAENLAEVARELNLGTDAFVFVDDRQSERLEMSLALPDVTVADFPPNLAAYFPPRQVTDEDRRKTEEYREEAARGAFRHALPKEVAPARLFKLLETRLEVHAARADEFARIAQLSQKANQFSVCTGRYDEATLRACAADGLVAVARAADRFGDLGLVAFAVVRGGEIMDWTMSCRAAGRGMEARFERALEKLLSARGVTTLSARWRGTAKNAPVRDLFDRLGFDCVAETDDERRYEKGLKVRGKSAAKGLSVGLDFERAAGDPVMGIDEAGRGPLVGGVYAAAVSVPLALAEKLLANEWRAINDSKKLSEKKRFALAEVIKTTAGCRWAVASASSAEIDQLNILNATHLAMRRAAEKVGDMKVLVDGLPVKSLPNSTNIVKGDAKSLLIAAASILAKTARDEDCFRLEREYPGYGFAKHKGYPTPAHLAALKKLGPCPEHRRSFAPVAQLELEL